MPPLLPRIHENETWAEYSERVLGRQAGIDEIEPIIRTYEDTYPGGVEPLVAHPLNRAYLGIAGIFAPDDAVQNNIATPVDVKKEKELYQAAKAYQARVAVRLKQKPSPKGDKEREYLELMRYGAWESKTNREIVMSELPVACSDLSSDRFYEIARSGLCPDLPPKGDGGYEVVCTKCVKKIRKDFMYFCAGRLYCSEHILILELCKCCGQLDAKYEKIKTFDNQEIIVCANCLARRLTCGICEKKIPKAYIEFRRCKEHLETMYEDRGPLRHFSWSMKWVAEQIGEIVQSKRIFSCELEALTPHQGWAHYLWQKLPTEAGIAQDGSVGVRNMSPFGFEVQTPRLGGKQGEEFVQRMVSVIKSLKYNGQSPTLDHTCGMHIHLEGKGIMPLSRHEYPAALVQLWKSYIVFEDVFLSFLPFMRRRNDYCRPLNGTFHLNEFDSIETIVDAEKILYQRKTPYEIREAKGQHYHASRYFGANFDSLLKDGHFEVRFHTGTLNAKKILEWANLHALILDACADKKMTNDFLSEVMATSRLSEKTQMLFEQIGLAESSRQYFRERQRKFGDKKMGDDEVPLPIPAKAKKLVVHDEFVQLVQFRNNNFRP